MKKTVIALLTLAGMAAAEHTFTTTNTVETAVSNFWSNGFALTLDPDADNTRLKTSVTPDGASITDYEEVLLTSVSTNLRNLQTAAGITLALTNASGTVLALSDESVSSTDYQTWSFTDTIVSTTETLYFVYTASDNDRIKVGYTLVSGGTGVWDESNKSYDMIMCGAGTLINYGDKAGVPTLAFLGDNNNRNMTLNNSQYAPIVNIVTKSMTSAVPEPTTATLSLLALAGLAARRRRK